MAVDLSKPLLRVEPEHHRDRRVGKPSNIPKPKAFPPERQSERFGPKFERLAEVLARDSEGLVLSADPSSLAPERLLVFELRGSVASFAAAINRVQGLELIDEEALASDDEDKNPVAYLLVPNARALAEIGSLWRRWQRRESLARGWTAWRDVFALLKDLRPWGPEDRIDARDSALLAQVIDGLVDAAVIRLEVELVFRHSGPVERESVV